MNTSPTTNLPLVNALKAHFFDIAKREQIGKTAELSSEADATERLIAMLDKKCQAQSQVWRAEPLCEGWHWLRRPTAKATVGYVRKVNDTLVVHTAGQPYQLSLLEGYEFCGPITEPA